MGLELTGTHTSGVTRTEGEQSPAWGLNRERSTMPLTDVAVRQARPNQKEYKLCDERGLLLIIRPNGSKWWRLRYRFGGLEKMISLGVYPDVSLSMARERRDAARREVANNIDPSVKRQAEQAAAEAAACNTFELIARSYLASIALLVRKGKRSIRTYKKAKWMLETYIFPKLGERPITQITGHELLVELKKIETQGLNETARRTKQRCGAVFRHAIGLGHLARDITVDLRGLLEPPTVEHHAAITDPRKVGELLLDIDDYSGRFITRCALRLKPLRRRSRQRGLASAAMVDRARGMRQPNARCNGVSSALMM
jgi:hypothetical protein